MCDRLLPIRRAEIDQAPALPSGGRSDSVKPIPSLELAEAAGLENRYGNYFYHTDCLASDQSCRTERVELIRQRVQGAFYFSDEVLESIAERLLCAMYPGL
jgi:hypothetical protein